MPIEFVIMKPLVQRIKVKKSTNTKSSKTYNKNSTKYMSMTGVKGVYPSKAGRFRAVIYDTTGSKPVSKHLGTWSSIKEAKRGYRAAYKSLYGSYPNN